MSDERTYRIGRHVLRYEPPDTMFVKFTGDISGSDVRELIARRKSWMAGHEYALILADMSDAGKPSAEARQAGAQQRDYEVRGTAFFGASPQVRIIANLVATAASLLVKRQDNPVQFFATEEEARAWLLERRRKILAERR